MAICKLFKWVREWGKHFSTSLIFFPTDFNCWLQKLICKRYLKVSHIQETFEDSQFSQCFLKFITTHNKIYSQNYMTTQMALCK